MNEALLGIHGSWLGLLGTIALTLTGYVANRYVIPFLQVGKRQKYAQFVAIIADELTDELRGKHPEQEWLVHLDDAVDSLIAICGVSPEIARRASRRQRQESKKERPLHNRSGLLIWSQWQGAATEPKRKLR